MTELLSRLRLASGMPFGILLNLAVLAGLVGIGVVGALRHRRRSWGVAAICLAVLAGGRLALGIASEVFIQEDLNPVVGPMELVGSWSDGAQALVLDADRTFRLTGPTKKAGTWDLRDQELSLSGMKARVIRVNGAYHIIPFFPDDADLWDGRLGFGRSAAR